MATKNRKYDRNRKRGQAQIYKASNRREVNKKRKIARDLKLKQKAIIKWTKRNQLKKPTRGNARKSRRNINGKVSSN